MSRAVVLLLLVLPVVTWAGCGRARAPENETDEPCRSRRPDRDWVRGSTAQETAGITTYPSLVEMSVGGSTPYAGHHRGWHYIVSGIVGQQSRGVCTVERRVVWHRGESCEVEHTRLDVSEAECRALLTCARSSTPKDEDGAFRRCDDAIQLDGTTMAVEWSRDGRYRGCEWTDPPACVGDEVQRIWRQGMDAGAFIAPSASSSDVADAAAVVVTTDAGAAPPETPMAQQEEPERPPFIHFPRPPPLNCPCERDLRLVAPSDLLSCGRHEEAAFDSRTGKFVAGREYGGLSLTHGLPDGGETTCDCHGPPTFKFPDLDECERTVVMCEGVEQPRWTDHP